MAFDAYGAVANESKALNIVDFDALNKYVVETAQLEQPETMIGFISNIVDLGTQKQPDATYDVDSGDEDLSVDELNKKYATELAEGKIAKFEMAFDYDTKTNKIKKFVPQYDRQSITFSVDFPDIMVDKSPFFGGESAPKPLRLWFGGEFWDKEERFMRVGRLLPLKKTKDDKLGWTMHPRSTLYRMAVAGKVITSNEAFQPEQIDKLLGKSMQFSVQVYFNKGKDGREYYNEKMTFVGGLARGQAEHENVEANLIQFNSENDETALRELRKHVINSMSLATNFKDSVVRKQLLDLGRYKEEEVVRVDTSTKDSVEKQEAELDEIW